MTLDEISALLAANQAWAIGLGAVAGVAALLLAANRLRAMKEHRATLLFANILTVVAAALATMVSASGMWKFFTDILGETPLRIAFFAFIEIALFASALLARSRLLRDPEKATTGLDGIAVWVLATLTATLSALDSDSFREVCLRLVAPLIAAWMWERALAAERHVRLGHTAHRINWAITPERIFVWMRLAEARDRDVSQVDRARRRAKLGRSRLHLHLLQSKPTFAWRVRRAHRNVIRQAMHAAEHIGLADFPDAANERQALQMYMATLYGFVHATSPQAVAHLNAWQAPVAVSLTNKHATAEDDPAVAVGGAAGAANGAANSLHRVQANANPLDNHRAPVDTSHHDEASHRPGNPHGQANVAGADTPQFRAPQPSHGLDTTANGHRSELAGFGRTPDLDAVAQPATPIGAPRDNIDDLHANDEPTSNEHLHPSQADETVTAVEAMRRFWDKEVTNGRVPTGAQLSRAAGVTPTTGLGRRKRREWQTELPEYLTTANASSQSRTRSAGP